MYNINDAKLYHPASGSSNLLSQFQTLLRFSVVFVCFFRLKKILHLQKKHQAICCPTELYLKYPVKFSTCQCFKIFQKLVKTRTILCFRFVPYTALSKYYNCTRTLSTKSMKEILVLCTKTAQESFQIPWHQKIRVEKTFCIQSMEFSADRIILIVNYASLKLLSSYISWQQLYLLFCGRYSIHLLFLRGRYYIYYFYVVAITFIIFMCSLIHFKFSRCKVVCKISFNENIPYKTQIQHTNEQKSTQIMLNKNKVGRSCMKIWSAFSISSLLFQHSNSDTRVSIF